MEFVYYYYLHCLYDCFVVMAVPSVSDSATTHIIALFERGFDQTHFIFNCLLSVVEFSAGVSTDKLDAKRPETKHRVEGE